MVIHKPGRSSGIRLPVLLGKKNAGKKEQGALILPLPSECCVYFLRAAGLNSAQ